MARDDGSQLRIGIITPAPPHSRAGNRVTALRWARLLRQLGHRVSIKQSYAGEDYDLLIALHARRSHAAAQAFRAAHPDKPLIVALTGTDLYQDLPASAEARASLELATRLIVLQPKAIEELPAHAQAKARLIYQSVASDLRPQTSDLRPRFTVCVIGHLREVKDPFRTAEAARLLPAASRVRVLQIGGALDEAMAERARAEMRDNPRYRWLGEKPRWRARQLLAQSDLCVLSSRLEGGANALSEAIVAGTPLLASRISGNIGLLGEDYPGYFAVGDTRGLADLLWRAETEVEFLQDLRSRVSQLAERFQPQCEARAWQDLLAEIITTDPL
jgi:putative glycosyltransferase (TIGR04348 family)